MTGLPSSARQNKKYISARLVLTESFNFFIMWKERMVSAYEISTEKAFVKILILG